MTTTNPLRLLYMWRRSPPPKQPDPIKFFASCKWCESIFFGDTLEEVTERELTHQSRGYCLASVNEVIENTLVGSTEWYRAIFRRNRLMHRGLLSPVRSSMDRISQ